MKKIIALVVCLTLLLVGCASGESLELTQAELALPTTETSETAEPSVPIIETEPEKVESAVLSYGNLNFSLLGDQEISSENDDGMAAKITPNTSAISVFYSEIIDYLGGRYTAAMQHAGFINLEDRVSSDYSYFNLPILDESVEFTITATTNGMYWLIGTFYDEQYVYTISYCTTDASESELANLTDFLGRIEPVEDQLEITSYTH